MPTAFATTDDLAARLGRDGLTSAETPQATALLDAATANIADAAGKGEGWIDDLIERDKVPRALKDLTVEIAVRAMSAPAGLRSQTKTIGAVSRSETYADAAIGGLELTTNEVLRVRRVVFGRNSASVVPRSSAGRLSRALAWARAPFIEIE